MYSIALSNNIGKIVSPREFVTLDEDTIVAEAAKVMRDKDISCVIVVRRGSQEPIGIVTERDMLYRVLAKNIGPYKVTLQKIMSSPVVTIDEQFSVADAISLMRSKHIRRLMVTRKLTDNRDGIDSSREHPIGVVTLMSITGNIPSNSVDLAELEVLGDVIQKENIKIICPYCQSKFENKAEMSKHIDQIHVGKGLLEGDLRQW